jgi:hypothetical protein
MAHCSPHPLLLFAQKQSLGGPARTDRGNRKAQGSAAMARSASARGGDPRRPPAPVTS